MAKPSRCFFLGGQTKRGFLGMEVLMFFFRWIPLEFLFHYRINETYMFYLNLFFFVGEILLFCYRGCTFFFVVFYRLPKGWGVQGEFCLVGICIFESCLS